MKKLHKVKQGDPVKIKEKYARDSQGLEKSYKLLNSPERVEQIVNGKNLGFTQLVSGILHASQEATFIESKFIPLNGKIMINVSISETGESGWIENDLIEKVYEPHQPRANRTQCDILE